MASSSAASRGVHVVLLSGLFAAGCECGPRSERPAAADPAAASAPASEVGREPEPAGSACGEVPAQEELEPGIRLERIPAAADPPLPIGDRCLLVVRADPERFPPRLLAAADHGGVRTAREWAQEFGLVAVVNASMYLESGRSTGLMIDGDRVNNPAVNRSFGAFFAFDPLRDGLPRAAMFGRGCPGFDLDQIRRDYRAVIQNYRLLECDGSPVSWRDRRAHSAAAVGIDGEGNVVFALSRTPYRVDDFARMLAAPPIGLPAAMYVEGGSEASLYLAAGGRELSATGSYRELLGAAGDDASWPRPIPNVIGLGRAAE